MGSFERENEIIHTALIKAQGLYSISSRSIKHIGPPLSVPINRSIGNEIYPSKLKNCYKYPIICKVNDESDPSSYRRISLTSILNRIYEKNDVLSPKIVP